MSNPLSYLKDLNGLSKEYRILILKIYLVVVKLVLTVALPNFLKGIYYILRGKKEEQYREFIRGSLIWGNEVVKMTETRVLRFNEIVVPPSGHMIFLNHVNEIDFPFDCLVISKPFLANQAIKSSVFAYWWMSAMGSQVFDTSHQRTISKSVRNLVAGLSSRSFIVYPEGGNSYSEEIRPLKKGMIKVAFEEKVPVFVVLKSGQSGLQTNLKKNTILYKSCGTLDPTQYESWEGFRDAIYNCMSTEKKKLDSALAEGKFSESIQ